MNRVEMLEHLRGQMLEQCSVCSVMLFKTLFSEEVHWIPQKAKLGVHGTKKDKET